MPRTSPEPIADEKRSNSDWDRESDESGNGGDAEDGANRDDTAKYQQCQTDADDGVEPHGVDGSLCVLIDLFPDAGEREAVITGVSVRDSTGSHHAALTHAEAADNGYAEDSEGGLFGHDLKEVCRPWLAERGAKHAADINHSIRSDELEEPPKEPAEARGHDDSARRGNAGVTTFFRQVEGGVVAGHGPDDGDEGHEDGNAWWEFGPWVNGAPNFGRRREAWQALFRSVCVCRD